MIRRAGLWSLFVGLMLVAGVGAVSFERRNPECTYVDTDDALDPAQPDTVAHIAQDLARIRGAAMAFRQEVLRRPPESDWIDAKVAARTAPLRAQAWCEATLEEEAARRHHLTAAQLRGLKNQVDALEPAQADADRASDTESTSSVVSRPSR